MNRPVLIESSWYIQLARKHQDPLLVLDSVVFSRPIATCGMVMAEVGRGIRSPETLQRYQAAWNEMLVIPSTPTVWNRTLQMAWKLDREGKVLPIQDIHIAACALEISAVVLTFDTHFREISGLTVTDCLY